jgi:hypothetical protein
MLIGYTPSIFYMALSFFRSGDRRLLVGFLLRNVPELGTMIGKQVQKRVGQPNFWGRSTKN